MTYARATFVLVASVIGLVFWAGVWPDTLNSQNKFINAFVDEQFLSLLGVILSITLASAGQIHLSLRQMEADIDRENHLEEPRNKVKQAAYSLIFLFCCGFIAVIAKSVIPSNGVAEAGVNAAAIFIVIFNILVLISLTEAAFGIKFNRKKSHCDE